MRDGAWWGNEGRTRLDGDLLHVRVDDQLSFSINDKDEAIEAGWRAKHALYGVHLDAVDGCQHVALVVVELSVPRVELALAEHLQDRQGVYFISFFHGLILISDTNIENLYEILIITSQ